MKLIKCKKHKEIFELVNETKRWVENWDTFMFLGYDINNVEIIPFDELKSYKVGDTKKVTTVTQIIKGKAPNEIFYPDEPEENHKTDRLYKMLYVCPCTTHDSDAWLN